MQIAKTSMNIFPKEKIVDPIEKLNFDMINGFANRSEEYYADIEEIYKDFPFDLLIADSLFPAIPFVKVNMHIPVIAVGIVPLAEDSVDLAPYGMALPPTMDEEKQAEYEKLRDFAKNVLFKPSIDAFDTTLKKNGIFVEKSAPFNLLIKEANLYLQIGTPGFEYKRSDIGRNIRFVGALLPYSSQNENKIWYNERLSKYSKIVLVTQGTVEKDTTKLLEPTLAAFKDTDVLVIATTGGSGTEELRKNYAGENVIIEDFIPFLQVMPYATVYVTNGGYGGTLLSIKNKLPMVAAGVHEGKNEVCKRIGYFSIGIDLQTETPTPEAIREAVEEVISNAAYKEHIKGLSEELATYNPEEVCAEYMADLLAEKAYA
jgi:MGT family glycosyltransferase